MAAGLGTRLRPLTERWAKPVLPVDGEPVLVLLLRELAAAGCVDVTVVVGHLGGQVRRLCGDGSDVGLRLRYAVQARPDGSAGAVAVAAAEPPYLVLGADTTVVVDQHVLEKPADAEDAVRMLERLAGRSHHVITAVALRADGTMRLATDVTRVTFRPADRELLRAYVATGEPMDKAGAYGIQGFGAALVDRIEGDFFGVMGLPVRLVLRLLEEAGHPYAPPQVTISP